MNLTTIFVLAAALHVSANGLSQRITIFCEKAPLRSVMKDIEKQTGLKFFYKEKLLSGARPVSINVRNGTLEETLSQCFIKQPLEYKIVDKLIVLKEKPVDPFVFPEIIAEPSPPFQVSGRIVNETGEPLQGVSVIVKGTRIGTTTDANGNYSINVPDNSSRILVFSFIGMEVQERSVFTSAELSITMKALLNQEEEIIVRGYGTQKKVNLTGSVASIGGDRLVDRPVTNIASAIQGTMPGVQVIVQSAQLGRDAGTIRVRGVGTMNNADPLVVVDGMIASMNELNPNDIESISVLKDASAAAIYGSRGANGVILVTTKRGKSGVSRVSYNGYFGKQELITMHEFVNSYEYATLYNEALRNQGQPERYTAEELEGYRKTVEGAPDADPVTYPNTDWMDLLWQGKGILQGHNVSMSGGNENSKYLLSMGYLKQDGLIKNNSNERYNIRLNVDSKISDRFTVGVTSSMSHKTFIEPTNGAPAANTVLWAILLLHRVPAIYGNKTPDGQWINHTDGNPIAWIEERWSQSVKTINVLGDVFGEYAILPELKLRGSAGIDYNNMGNTLHSGEIFYSNGSYQGPNYLYEVAESSTRILLQSTLTYQKSFGSHNLSAVGGVARESYRFDHLSADRRDFPSFALTELDAGSTVGWANAGRGLANSLGSYFGRVNYDYKGKYLLEGSIRRDGSSKFAADKRWGTFPSFSAGWRLSEENFIKNINSISNLKLRLSYGSAGNNQTADYQYIPRISLGRNYPFFNQITAGAVQAAAANPDLQWEKSTTFDVGVDLGLFNNRLNFTIDYYDRYTDNILIGVPVSAIYGLAAPTVNAGAMRNKGVELLVSHNNRVGDFTYHASANVAYNKNTADKFANPILSDKIYSEGYEWAAWYGYEVLGLYQTEDQLQNLPKIPGAPVILGDFIFKDQNKDGVINGLDRVVLGSDIPRITYGFNLGAEYKNFDLSIFGQGMSTVKQNVNYHYLFAFFNGATAPKRALDRWTPETPNSPNPATHLNQYHNYQTLNSKSVINANYMRLKNVQLGYTIPQSVLNKIKISNIRIYVGAENLLTFTKMWDGLDPESSVNREYDGDFPNMKTYTIGLNVNF